MLKFLFRSTEQEFDDELALMRELLVEVQNLKNQLENSNG